MNLSLILKPVDRLFFRNGKPFNAGETGYVKSIFPPSPTTGYGFARAYLLESGCKHINRYIRSGCTECEINGCQLKDVVGSPSLRNGSLRTLGPYLQIEDEKYYPTPLDLLISRNHGENVTAKGASIDKKPVFCDKGNIRLPTSGDGYSFSKKTEDTVISHSCLMEYLSGSPIKCDKLFSLRAEREHISENTMDDRGPLIYDVIHTGIQIQTHSRTTRDHYLYRIGLIHFAKNCDLWLGLNIPESSGIDWTGTMRFGGEGRRVWVRPDKFISFPTNGIESFIKETGRVKLLLLQHADFDGNWLPPGFKQESDGNLDSWIGEISGVAARIVSACVGRQIMIGGWDTSQSRSRPMRALVPAGSVYYLKIDPNDTDDFVSKIHDNTIGLQTNLGLGHVVLGAWNYE